MAKILSKKENKEEENKEVEKDVRNLCHYCDKEYEFEGTFQNNWFTIPVFLCKDHLYETIDRTRELEKLQYVLPTEFPEVSDDSDEEVIQPPTKPY